MSQHGPRHLGHSKSWIYAVGNEPPAKADCKNEKGWQFLRCFIGAQGAASLSLEAGFQYTDTGKLSLARVLSETNLSQLATGFRGLGQRRSYRKAPKGAKPIAHIYVVLMVSLQRKVDLRNKLWFSWEQSRRRATGGVISHNLQQHVSQYSKQEARQASSLQLWSCVATPNNKIFTEHSHASAYGDLVWYAWQDSKVHLLVLAAGNGSGHWWSKRRKHPATSLRRVFILL